MKTVKLSEAKNNLSRYVAEVRAGGRIRVAVRGRPVVELVRIEGPEPLDEWEDEVVALVRRGLVRGPRRRPGAARELLRPGPPLRGRALSSTLVEGRRSSR
jgi:prevent-host-death family protein